MPPRHSSSRPPVVKSFTAFKVIDRAVIDFASGPKSAAAQEHIRSQRAFSRMLNWASVVFALCIATGKLNAYTSNDVSTAFSSYTNVFYVTSGANSWFRNLQNGGTGATYFWGQANEIECVIDAYEVTTNAIYK